MRTHRHIAIGLFSTCLFLGFILNVNAQGYLDENTVTSPSLEGNPLGDPATRNLIIYLPPGYDTSLISYPVVYLLHSAQGNERFFPYNEFPPSFEASGVFTKPQDYPAIGFTGLIDSLIDAGDIDPMIIAMPNINTAYGGSFCINSELNGNYENYMIQDIVPFMDSTYRTLPHRNSRALLGQSMGGFSAIYLSMKHPDVFGLVGGHSSVLCMDALARASQPMIKAENPEGLGGPDPAKPLTSFMYMFSAALSPNLNNPPFFVDLPYDDTCALKEDVLLRWAANDPIQLFANHVPALHSLNGIYLDVGDKDELQSGFFVAPFSEALNAVGKTHSFEVFDGMHFSNLYSRLSMSLKFLSDSLEHTDISVHIGSSYGTVSKTEPLQNYPNPFDKITIIKYGIEESGWVSIKLYNMNGQEVESLIDKHMTAGQYEVSWHPEQLQGGMYICALKTRSKSQMKKLIYLK